MSDVDTLLEGIRAGHRRSLARAITLTESTREDHRAVARELLTRLGPGGETLRVGVSGVPGAGKSTFIEALGTYVLGAGRRVAVLSIDPSSAISGGAILGDKTRMASLARSPDAFIRPSPAGATLGGVARRTRETMALVEAAGYDLVIVETVGVGQSETTAASITDMFILLLAPAAGDDLQGIKRGIAELADLVLVNKADGELRAAADRAASDYANAQRLLRPRRAHWTPRVMTCSSLKNEGVEAVWNTITEFDTATRQAGEHLGTRRAQARHWLWQETSDTLIDMLRASPLVARVLPDLERAVERGDCLPGEAADRLIAAFRTERGDPD
jgi:LAO/AO transport system kinase